MVGIVEVGPRDGLQSLDHFVTTPRKVELVERLIAAGLREIEVTSFAHPKVVPHLADAADLLAALPRPDGVRYRALVPNFEGAVRAVAAGVDLVVALVSASAEYSARNQHMTINEMLAQLERISAVAHEAGIGWAAGISMAFGSPYEGAIEPAEVFRLIARCVELEPEHVYVADTIGRAEPEAVSALCAATRVRWPELPLAVHLHGSGERGLECAIAAVRAGAAQVETSIRGLGGPIVRSPGTEPVGNLATEEVVARFAQLGIETGLDPAAVQAAADDVAALLR
jgi:hydroxymethylglutaryl-CoA lyase